MKLVYTKGYLALVDGVWVEDYSEAYIEVEYFGFDVDGMKRAIERFEGTHLEDDFERWWDSEEHKPICGCLYAALELRIGDDYWPIDYKMYVADDHYDKHGE